MQFDADINGAMEALLVPFIIIVLGGFAAYASENHMSEEAKEEYDRYDRFMKEQEEKENLENWEECYF